MESISEFSGVVGLLFFLIFFVVIVAWLFRPGAKSEYKKYGDIPLKEGKCEGDENE